MMLSGEQKMKAVIAVISDLSTDMRVRKLAKLMVEEGLEVTVLGRHSGAEPPPPAIGVNVIRIKVK